MSSSDADASTLRARLAQAGYTPGRRDVAPLVAMLADDADAGPAIRKALARADVARVTSALIAALASAEEGSAIRLVPALGDAAAAEQRAAGPGGDSISGGVPPARAALLAALDDARPRVRKAAVTALGKLGGDEARAALIAYWDRADLPPDHRRAAADALGKVGGAEAAQRLAAPSSDAHRDTRSPRAPGTIGADRAAGPAADGPRDAELERRKGRALLIAERDADDAPSEIALDVAPPAPVTMVARCRTGLETILAAELHDLGFTPSRLGPGLVMVELARPLRDLLSARTLLAAGALVPLSTKAAPKAARPSRGEADAASIAEALADPDVLALLTAWTHGPIRWRLDFERGGHRRALVWDAAAKARALAPALRNQPRATTWDVIVTADEQHLELQPRRYDDTRFAWRKADVPASSHPTIAAALARVAGAVAGEHVWDPFVGSGAELCERGRLGAARLHGTDLDERALTAARANLDAAGLQATLTRADALVHTPPPLGLIITNPPLGRRLRGDAASLLEDFAARVPRLLARAGRLVWITPSPDRTAPVLRRGGLTLRFARDIDLGGYEARLERWDR